jgi:hypothetical protein
MRSTSRQAIPRFHQRTPAFHIRKRSAGDGTDFTASPLRLGVPSCAPLPSRGTLMLERPFLFTSPHREPGQGNRNGETL